MSSLPPYSTYRTDNKQMMFPQATSHGNILTFTPPGFKQELNVKFPDSRLAVCEKCKKNFKTRDMCRVRNTHTTAPWTTAYICLTLDESCTDANGNYIDGPLTVRMVQWQPFCVREPFDPKTPVCASCKKTNRTRSFCRERHKHRQLPWCTVYVLLSALETADPSTVVAGPSKLVSGSTKTDEQEAQPKDEESKDEESKDEESKDAEAAKSDPEPSPTNSGVPDEASAAESKASESLDGVSENIKPDDGKKAGGEEGDDVNVIAESRTFLARVDCNSISIHWLEMTDIEVPDPAGMTSPMGHPGHGYAIGPPPVQPADPSQAHYYQHAMGYAAQQHQNALKNQQQYFFQMQQRHHQHYAAQQAVWQAHYNQPPHPAQGQPPQPPVAQASAAAAPPSADSGLATPPVTAGEAAAQQQKLNQEMAEQDQGHSPPPPPAHTHPGPPGTQPPPGQQQQWMLYQQMYQAQLPPIGNPPAYPQRVVQPPEGGVMMPNNDQPYSAPPPTEGNGKAHDEMDSKRQRLA